MNKKTSPRKVPNRDDFYLGLAFCIAAKSKDPRTQCGALIVGSGNRPMGMGYNGPPPQIRDEDIDWARPAKYPFIVHAEENAINHSFGDLCGAVLYVTGIPCNKCMLTIVNAGIVRVIYKPANADSQSMLVNPEIAVKTEEIARLGNVRLEKFSGDLNWMRDHLYLMEEKGIFREV